MTAAQAAMEDAGASTEETEGSTPEKEAFSKDEIFHVLQNKRRRDVLRYLERVDGQVEMRDIAEQVAAWEHDTTVEALTSKERQRVYIALYQAHLPKLDEKGIIEYNQSRGYVERTERADQLLPYLDLPVESEDDASADETSDSTPWHVYYLATSALGSALLAVTALDVSLFADVSDIVAGFVILTMFALLTLGQLGERYLGISVD
jgi:hypothetical protein